MHQAGNCSLIREGWLETSLKKMHSKTLYDSALTAVASNLSPKSLYSHYLPADVRVDIILKVSSPVMYLFWYPMLVILTLIVL